jgi:abequosyltransferase
LKYRIAICIPTKNRAELLKETVASVLRGNVSDVQVVISDNASEDATQEVASELCSRHGGMKYHRWARDVGVDANILKVVQLADADYCWLMGSDDCLAVNSLAMVKELLGMADIVLMPRCNMTRDMQTLMSEEAFVDCPLPARFDTRIDGEMERYLASARGLGGLFSYMSSLVFRKTLWQRKAVRRSHVGSYYVHVSKLLSMLAEGATLYCVGGPGVLNRTDNDSFGKSLGYARRRIVDLNLCLILNDELRDNPRLLSAGLRIAERDLYAMRVLLSNRRSALLADGRVRERELQHAYVSARGVSWRGRGKAWITGRVPLWILDGLHRIYVGRRGQCPGSVSAGAFKDKLPVARRVDG